MIAFIKIAWCCLLTFAFCGKEQAVYEDSNFVLEGVKVFLCESHVDWKLL